MISGIQALERIALPQPRLVGEMSVEEALHRRRSVREYDGGPLSPEEIGFNSSCFNYHIYIYERNCVKGILPIIISSYISWEIHHRIWRRSYRIK